MTNNLEFLRNEINQIDERLLQLLNQRQLVVQKIGAYKHQQNLSIRDPKREAHIIKQLKQLAREENFLLSDRDIENIFQAIINQAFELQINLKQS